MLAARTSQFLRDMPLVIDIVGDAAQAFDLQIAYKKSSIGRLSS